MKALIVILIACSLQLNTLSAQDTGPRLWTSADGLEQMEATLQDVDGLHVILESNGQTRRIALKNLSEADRLWVGNWLNFRQAAAAADLPTPSPAPTAPSPTTTQSTPETSGGGMFDQLFESIPAESSDNSTDTESNPFSQTQSSPQMADEDFEEAVRQAELSEGGIPQDLPIIPIIIAGAGLLIGMVGSIIFLIAAFRESVLWGLGSIFVPFVSLVFLIMFFHDAKKGFFISLFGTLIYVGGLAAVFIMEPALLESVPVSSP